MKKLFRAAAVLFAFVLILTAFALAEGDTRIVVNCESWVSLRAKPSQSATRVTKVPFGAEVTDCVDQNNGWVSCKYGSKKGYILSEYLDYPETQGYESIYENDGFVVYMNTSYADDGKEYLSVWAEDHNTGNESVWSVIVNNSVVTELSGTAAFAAGSADDPLIMVYSATDGLRAIEAATGEERWKITSYDCRLGASICWTVGPDACMYIAGYYGPDPVAITKDGEILWQSDVNDADIFWPTELSVEKGKLIARYASAGMTGSGFYNVTFDLKNGSKLSAKLVK